MDVLVDLDENLSIGSSFLKHRDSCGELYRVTLRRFLYQFIIRGRTLLSLQVCNTTTDRKHADTFLERCVTESVMNIVSGFFNSPFSDNSTSLQVADPSV